MKLDSTAKVASITSVAVGVFVSLSGWYMGQRIQESQEALAHLIQEEKKITVEKGQMDVRKSANDESARLSVEFSVPMARSFALQYKTWLENKEQSRDRYVVPAGLSDEIAAMWPTWANREGLMTGKACEPEGLLARQIVMLVVKNIGRADAVDVKLIVQVKRSPMGQPARAWRESGPTGPVSYDKLTSLRDGWDTVELKIPDLRGTSTAEADRKQHKVVLASVSGRSALYGTVIVPIRISWEDRVTKQRRDEMVLEPNAATVNAELMGAEIGRIGSLCPNPPAQNK